MIKNIFSKKDPDKLLHVIYDMDNQIGREDLCPSEKFLQVSVMRPPKDKKYDAHYHIWKDNTFDQHIAQESWLVISGSIRVVYYDIDNEFLHEEVINAKGCTITFEGGHSYEILEDNTQVYEFKTGPYFGRERDKKFITIK
jgi:hypothetical protein